MNDPSSRPRLPAYLLVAILSVAAIAAAWYFRPAPVETDPAYLRSGVDFKVSSEAKGLFFAPAEGRGGGLVFYPGARVPPEAYAWLGAGLAAKGHPVFIVRFPLNFAIFAPSRFEEAKKAHPEVARWSIGGHSLGGAMAAAFAASHRGEVGGLVLLAAWPPDSADLSASDLRVLSISGSEDGLATEAKLGLAAHLLPSTTVRVVIQGGDHAQFGEYGPQAGDKPALVEGARQRAMTLDAILAFLGGTAEGN